ncbi:MAG: hypothetical protein IJ121_00315 [Eubacterium sp.]|nr:hypothetical protein [Eubacterium sp.]
MKKSTVSRLLSMTLALSMTLGGGSMAVFADSEDPAAEVETVSVVEEDAENAVPAEDTAEETEVVTEAVDTEAEVETVVQSAAEEAAAAETAVTEEIAVETQAAADDSAGVEIEAAAAEETEQTDAALEAEAEFSGYVLMNIPYSAFYAAEGLDGVDTVTSATVKTYNQNMAGGSYHSGALNVTDPDTDDPLDGAEILGVTYPVKVNGDKSVLEGKTEVTNESTATITVATGKKTRDAKEVSGKDVLFASGDYAYYVLSEAPSNYKELTVDESGAFIFSAVKNAAQERTATKAELTYGGHYTPLTLSFEAPEIDDNAVVTGIILTTAEGSYALRHVENIWRKTELGWEWEDLDETGLSGKTITSITYYLQDGGVYKYNTNIYIKPQYKGSCTVVFNDLNTILVNGLPDDLVNAKASLYILNENRKTVLQEDIEIKDGKIVTTDPAVYGEKYVVVIESDNYADITSVEEKCMIKELSSTSIGGLTYFYANRNGDDDDTVYQATVKKRRDTIIYVFTSAQLTRVGETDYYYGVETGVTPLTGTLYGYGDGTETTYKEVYSKLGITTDASYDVISSATTYTSHHAGDIPSLVLFGTDENGDKAITGLSLGRVQKTVDAEKYVEASILSAAGEELTEEQREIIGVPLKVNPMKAPAKTKIKPETKSAEYTLSKYGVGEFKIVPNPETEGFDLKEYWSNVYAATISDGTTTVGAVHWVDLYGESGHDNLELELNNGKALATNEQEVNRYAAFFDESGCLKAGTYTITLYAEGYEDFKVSVEVTAEKAQAYAANALIKALSQNEYSTAAEAQAAVNAAKTAFQNLTDAQRELLKVSEEDITKAQTAATAQKEAEENAAAVEQVKALIAKANEKFATSDKAQAAVNAAKAAFQNLTEDQKALIGKEEIKELENALNKAQTAATAQKTAEDKAAEKKAGNKQQTVKKQSQSLKKLTPATKKLKASKLKKKKQTFKLKATINGQGKVTFKKVSGNKKIKISKAGKVTVKKGLKKGTYKVKVKVSIAATGNYTAAEATKTIKIKVK